jgi:hypothetical protein
MVEPTHGIPMQEYGTEYFHVNCKEIVSVEWIGFGACSMDMGFCSSAFEPSDCDTRDLVYHSVFIM